MEFTLTMRMDLEALKALRESKGARAEAEAHALFFKDSLIVIADELLQNGVHPEVIEEAFGLVRLDVVFAKKG
jgi:hypothetical protein